eukprot:6210120-Pleurochrysis_carterae.AAC.3
MRYGHGYVLSDMMDNKVRPNVFDVVLLLLASFSTATNIRMNPSDMIMITTGQSRASSIGTTLTTWQQVPNCYSV